MFTMHRFSVFELGPVPLVKFTNQPWRPMTPDELERWRKGRARTQAVVDAQLEAVRAHESENDKPSCHPNEASCPWHGRR